MIFVYCCSCNVRLRLQNGQVENGKVLSKHFQIIFLFIRLNYYIPIGNEKKTWSHFIKVGNLSHYEY